MTTTRLVQARIDGTIKEEAAAVLAGMGLTVSDAVRLLLTRIAQDKALPFQPGDDWTPNETTIQAMRDADEGRTEPVTIDELRSIAEAETLHAEN